MTNCSNFNVVDTRFIYGLMSVSSGSSEMQLALTDIDYHYFYLTKNLKIR